MKKAYDLASDFSVILDLDRTACANVPTDGQMNEDGGGGV